MDDFFAVQELDGLSQLLAHANLRGDINARFSSGAATADAEEVVKGAALT